MNWSIKFLLFSKGKRLNRVLKHRDQVTFFPKIKVDNAGIRGSHAIFFKQSAAEGNFFLWTERLKWTWIKNGSIKQNFHEKKETNGKEEAWRRVNLERLAQFAGVAMEDDDGGDGA